MSLSYTAVPSDVKPIMHYMKLSEDYIDRNLVISYYARMAAIQLALKIVPNEKPAPVSEYLSRILSWLEVTKRENADNEGIINETVAQAMIEEYIIKIYDFAYQCEVNLVFNKNVVKAYYTAHLLCEILTQFGPLEDEMKKKSILSKYRATYLHNTMKEGRTPVPINVKIVKDEDEARRYVLSLDQVNERRALRGEAPLEPEDLKEQPLDEETQQFYSDLIANTDDTKIRENLDAEERRIMKGVEDEFNMTEEEIWAKARELNKNANVSNDQLVQIDDNLSNISQPVSNDTVPSKIGSVILLDPAQNAKAIKYCKWASSALQYDDNQTAVVNLEKALHLCRFGKEMD